MSVLMRLAAGVPLAMIIAVLLFLGMRALIGVADAPLAERADPPRIDVHVEAPDEVDPIRTAPEPAAAPLPPPPVTIKVAASNLPAESLATIAGRIPEFERPGLQTDAINFNVTDRDAQPQVRIGPQYPPRAAERGLEGYCVMRFDVAPGGQPVNIQAADCSSSLFESASIRAVERWKYAPKIVNGAAVARSGVVTRLDYRLE